jgi:hypothetical protein
MPILIILGQTILWPIHAGAVPGSRSAYGTASVQQCLAGYRTNKLEEELPLQRIGGLAEATRSPPIVGIGKLHRLRAAHETDRIRRSARLARHPTVASMFRFMLLSKPCAAFHWQTSRVPLLHSAAQDADPGEARRSQSSRSRSRTFVSPADENDWGVFKPAQFG